MRTISINGEEIIKTHYIKEAGSTLCFGANGTKFVLTDKQEDILNDLLDSFYEEGQRPLQDSVFKVYNK